MRPIDDFEDFRRYQLFQMSILHSVSTLPHDPELWSLQNASSSDVENCVIEACTLSIQYLPSSAGLCANPQSRAPAKLSTMPPSLDRVDAFPSSMR